MRKSDRMPARPVAPRPAEQLRNRSFVRGAPALGLAILLTATVPAVSQVAAWQFAEGVGQTVHDGSGHGHDGRLGAEPTADGRDPEWLFEDGGESSYLRFDGGDLVRVESTERLEPAAVSVEVCFRRDGSPGSNRYLLAKGADACRLSSYAIYSHEGGLAFYVSDGQSYVASPLVGPEVWDGRWHHAVGTYDGSRVRLFLDGDEVGPATPAVIEIAYDVATDRALYLGHFPGTCDLAYRGDLDEVRVYDRAVDLEEVLHSSFLCRYKELCLFGVDRGTDPQTLTATTACSTLAVEAGESITVTGTVP